MLEAFIVVCCLGIPFALGVVATLRTSKKNPEATVSSPNIEERRRE
jgi:hypothetical protein